MVDYLTTWENRMKSYKNSINNPATNMETSNHKSASPKNAAEIQETHLQSIIQLQQRRFAEILQGSSAKTSSLSQVKHLRLTVEAQQQQKSVLQTHLQQRFLLEQGRKDGITTTCQGKHAWKHAENTWKLMICLRSFRELNGSPRDCFDIPNPTSIKWSICLKIGWMNKLSYIIHPDPNCPNRSIYGRFISVMAVMGL